MKIRLLGEPAVIMSNPHSKHNYFAWPSVTRLQNGMIAAVASGYRLRHVCPFGKTVISYSADDGESYTLPAAVIDTPLDDRDGGIVPFGKSGVIVTSFNNKVAFQRGRKEADPYSLAYLDTVCQEEEDRFLGSTFRVSLDGVVTFGEIYKSPVTSPHGPLELADGSLLWVGWTFNTDGQHQPETDRIKAYRLNPTDGSMEYMGQIENIRNGEATTLSCEPHSIQLEDGTILTHIRVEQKGEDRLFTIYQSESTDNGRTWTTPHPILSRLGGSPPHLFRHSSGLLLCTYGYREAPYGVKVMFSADNGKTWDTDHDLYVNGVNLDLGYPCTVERRDGTLLTVFYAHPTADSPAVILQQRWQIEEA